MGRKKNNKRYSSSSPPPWREASQSDYLENYSSPPARRTSPSPQLADEKMPGTEIAYIDLLDSDFVSLRVRQTGRSFRIHRKLLQSKSRPLIAALDSTLKEGQDSLYEFEDVKEGTVGRFIEWAYRGDYPTSITLLEPLPTPFIPDKVDTDIEDKPGTKSLETDFTSENHPLLVHVRLYIFSHIYIIPELQKLAYEKATACFADLDKPDGLDKQLAVIDAYSARWTGDNYDL